MANNTEHYSIDDLALNLLQKDDALPEAYTGDDDLEGFLREESQSFQSAYIHSNDLPDEEIIDFIKSIPDRMYFKIGEVAELVDIDSTTIRYWEKEFREYLKAKRSPAGQRMYSKKDVENIFLIKKLVHDEKYSILGAKKKMSKLKSQIQNSKKVVSKESLYVIKDHVDNIISKLEKNFYNK